MTPTPELRFVEREVFKNELGHNGIVSQRVVTQRILQQKWVGWKPTGNKHPCKETEDVIEWRDVPVVKEQANG
jgi:hypothetical protein